MVITQYSLIKKDIRCTFFVCLFSIYHSSVFRVNEPVKQYFLVPGVVKVLGTSHKGHRVLVFKEPLFWVHSGKIISALHKLCLVKDLSEYPLAQYTVRSWVLTIKIKKYIQSLFFLSCNSLSNFLGNANSLAKK